MTKIYVGVLLLGCCWHLEFMSNVVTHIFVSGESAIVRTCGIKSTWGSSGCQSATYSSFGKSDVCVCDTKLCNGAVIMSSAGHVLISVALIIVVITGYLM